MAQTLPRFISLQNDRSNRYLCHANDGFLKFSGEEIFSPYTKFEVEPAGNGLVHIRCCYNNKYWVCPERANWIIAKADERDENQTRSSCTLFRPHVIVGTNVVRLIHVFHNEIVRCYDIESSRKDCLYAGMPTENNILSDILIYTDWESLPIMPKHIAIKRRNGPYLGAHVIDGDGVYLKFNCENSQELRARHQVFTTRDGNIRIKSILNEFFWRCSPSNWISPNLAEIANDNYDMFRVTKTNDNMIAFRNLGNNYFCKGHTANNKNDCLHSSAREASEETELEVEELVTNRTISIDEFSLNYSRFYNESLVVNLDTIEYINYTLVPEENKEFHFNYQKDETQTFNASISWKLGVNSIIQSEIPCISNGTAILSGQQQNLPAYQWGEVLPVISIAEKTHVDNVPPRTKITVRLLASKVTCDTPFFYTQSDALSNGIMVPDEEMNDGLYTFTDTYDFRCETITEAIPEFMVAP